jgi:GTP cyclohydrolase II
MTITCIWRLVMGNVAGDEPVLVRVHARNLIDDLFFSKRSDCSLPVREAMKNIAEAGCGVLVIISQKEDNKALVELIHALSIAGSRYCQPDQTADRIGAPPEPAPDFVRSGRT